VESIVREITDFINLEASAAI